MLEFTPAENSFIIDGRARELSTPLWRDGNDMMIPVEVIHALYAVTVEYHAAYNTVIVNTTDTPRTTALSDVALLDVRYWSHFRSPIATQVPRGEVLTIFDSPDDFEYVRVRTREGLLGYALREELDSFHTGYIPIGREPMLVDFIDNFTAPPQAWTAGRMVNMAWQLGYSPAAFAGRMGENLPDGMNVVSPTFFRIAPGGGYFNSYGYAPYVAWAQAQGIAVWPKVFDVDSVRVAAFLTNRAARQQGIAQLLHYIDTLGLDGINIDFEHLLDPRLGAYKIQFLRELAIPMRMRGATLSAAVLMPMPHNHFYRIDLIGLTVCFVQLMAYDEHWGVDSGAGPNASLPWVSRWSARALELVPAYRLVLGLPFYNRMWREELLTGNLTQQAVGIAWGRTFFEERGVVWEWDAYYASYFGEVLVTEDGIPVRWRVWLECERSMRAKLHLVDVHGLAGTAGWQLGLETPGIWDTINLALGGG
jgi:spore germination protein YaaH